MLAPGEQAYIKAEDKIRLMDIQTNLYDSSGIGLYVGDRKIKKGTFFRPAVLLPDSSRHDGYDITIKNGSQTLGKVRISLQ